MIHQLKYYYLILLLDTNYLRYIGLRSDSPSHLSALKCDATVMIRLWIRLSTTTVDDMLARNRTYTCMYVPRLRPYPRHIFIDICMSGLDAARLKKIRGRCTLIKVRKLIGVHTQCFIACVTSVIVFLYVGCIFRYDRWVYVCQTKFD